MKGLIVIFFTFMIILPHLTAYAQMGSGSFSSPSKGSMPPQSNIEGLNEFHKELVFAQMNIAAGDFESALENLKNAQKIRKEDPLLYEMFGIAYDTDRQPEKAFEYYKKAGKTYFESGNMDKAWVILGWMRTINMKSKEVIELEKKLRKRQEVINRERFNSD